MFQDELVICSSSGFELTLRGRHLSPSLGFKGQIVGDSADAGSQELEEAEPILEEDVLYCHRTGRNWRLAMGERIFKHRG